MAPSPVHRIRRVALLTHEFAPFRDGIGRVAEGLALGATAEGREVVVLAPGYGGEGGVASGSSGRFSPPPQTNFVSRPGIEAVWHETPPIDRASTRADLGVGPTTSWS